MEDIIAAIGNNSKKILEGKAYKINFSLLERIEDGFYSVNINNTIITLESPSELENKVGEVKVTEISKDDIETIIIVEPSDTNEDYFSLWQNILPAILARDKAGFEHNKKDIEALYGNLDKKDVIAAKELTRTGEKLLDDLIKYDQLTSSINSIKERVEQKKDDAISVIESIKDMSEDEIYKAYEGLKDYFMDLLELNNTEGRLIPLIGSLNTKSSEVGLTPEQLFGSIKEKSDQIKLIEDDEKKKLASYEETEILTYLRRNYNPKETVKIADVVQATDDDFAEIIRLKAEGIIKLDKKVPKSMNLYSNPKIIWAYNLLRDESNYNIGLLQVEYRASFAYKALSGKNIKLKKIAVIIPTWFPTTVKYDIPAMINTIGKNYDDSDNDVYFGISDSEKSDFPVKGHPKWERLGKTKEGQILFKYKREK